MNGSTEIRPEQVSSSPNGQDKLAETLRRAQEISHRFQQEISALEETRQKQEEAFERLFTEKTSLEKRGRLSQGRSYSWLEPCSEKIKEARAAVSRCSESPVSAFRTSCDNLGKVFAVYKETVIRLRDINDNQKRVNEELEEQIKGLKDPFYKLPLPIQEICLGNLTLFFSESDLVDEATRLLERLMGGFDQYAPEIYHLAIFVATVSPEKFHPKESLYRNLREWIMRRNDAGEPLIKKREVLFRVLGGNVDCALRDLVLPIDEAVELSQTLKGLYSARKDSEVVEWARELLGKEGKSRIEREVVARIKATLDEIVHPDQLPDPKNPSHNLSLFEQLEQDPQFSHTVASTLNNSKKSWQESLSTRNTTIASLISQHCTKEAFINCIREPRDGVVPFKSTTPGADFGCVEMLAKRVAEGSLTPEVRTELLESVVREVSSLCTQLTGLKADNVAQFARDFCTRYVAGRIPSAFENIVSQGDGSYALLIAQLVYYHKALSHMQPRFEECAPHNDWDWLVNAADNIEAAKRMRHLIQAFHADSNFKGSVMTPKQAVWAHNLYDLMRTGKISPIYADAGSGKTSTAIFTIGVLRKLFPEFKNKDVHFIAPFYTQIEGFCCHQFTNRQVASFDITVSDDTHLENDVVIFDEAHTFPPDHAITLCSSSGNKRTVELLPMTATPVIPRDTYSEFRHSLRRDLQKQYAGLTKKHEMLTAQFENDKKNAALAAIEKIKGKIKKKANNYLLYTDHLPRAKQSHFQRHLDSVSVTELQGVINTLLRGGLSREKFAAHRLGRPYFSVEDGNIAQQALPSGTIPLQQLDKTKFEAAVQLFLELERDLQEIERLGQPNASFELPNELVDMGRALDEIRTTLRELETKLKKWEGQDRNHAILEEDELLREMPHKWQKKFETIDYRQKVLTRFTPESAAAELIDLPLLEGNTLQLIYPEVVFTTENFQPLLQALQGALQQKYPGKRIVFFYQNSHTDNGPPKGTKVMVRFPPEENGPFDRERDIAVLLYDRTNMQGGDFNEWSCETEDRPIQLSIFFHLSDGYEKEPTKAADVYQALSRRRGKPKSSPIVTGVAPSKEIFIATADKNQREVEELWGVRNRAIRLRKKLLKLVVPEARHKSADWLQRNVEWLKTTDITKELRKALPKIGRSESEITPRTAAQALLANVTEGATRRLIQDALTTELPTESDKKSTAATEQAEKFKRWRTDKTQREAAHLVLS